jgi:hypothetical protein
MQYLNRVLDLLNSPRLDLHEVVFVFKACVADALEGMVVQEFNFGRKIAGPGRLFSQ